MKLRLLPYVDYIVARGVCVSQTVTQKESNDSILVVSTSRCNYNVKL